MMTPASDEAIDGQRPGGDDVDQHADQREDVRVDAERHAGVDDGAQREHADGADRAGEGHRLHIEKSSLGNSTASGASRVRWKRPIVGARRPAEYPWPFTISRSRSRGCRISRGSISTPTPPARRIYVGKARSLRDRVRSYLGAYGTSPRHDALLDEVASARSDRHRLGGRSAGAREQPDQAAVRRATTSCCATTRTTRICS